MQGVSRLLRGRSARHALACLFLAGFALALLWPLCLGRALYWGDISLYFEPMSRFEQGVLRQGRLPLWNPYVLCGQPFLGNPQMAVFYPSTLLYPFLPTWVFLSISSALHLFLCGAFTYGYLEQRTRHSLPAMAGALVYMGSACLLGRLQFPPMVVTAAYFPLLLWCVDICIERPRLGAALRLAGVVALTVLAAHAQVAYLILATGICYASARLWRTRDPASEASAMDRHRAFLWLTGALGLGLLLTSAQIMPALQLLKESPREQMTAGQANRFVMEPAHLLTLIAPRFFGHPASGDYWGAGTAWEPALFIGWVPLLLIGYAGLRCFRQRRVRFWLVVAMLGIWLALGRDGGLYWLLFNVVPGLSNFHDPARLLFLTTFAFALLTAIGCEASLKRIARPGRFGGAALLIGIAAPLWWYGQDWNPATAPDNLRLRPAALTGELASRLHGGRLYLPAHDRLWKRFVTDGYNDYGANDTRTVATFMNTILPNLSMEYGIESASGYEPVPIYAPSGVDGLARNALRRGEPNLSRLLGLLNVKTLALPLSATSVDPRFAPVLSVKEGAVVSLWHNRDALPRSWIVPMTLRVDSPMRVASALASPHFHPEAWAVVSGETEALPTDREWIPADAANRVSTSVTVRSSSEVNLMLDADAGGKPGLLIYSGTAYPGWRAWLDGRETKLHRANGAFLGVSLPPGKHRISMRYEPAAIRVGLFLSLVACGLMATGGMVCLSRTLWGKRGPRDAKATLAETTDSRIMERNVEHSPR